ncbi:hypothetical protein TTHERM_000644629 (macronuclear) [Tetrahymena thermophila SB210]|uniref:Uncharacterized protein n=1 Tax=Tetrahymena thermophila (strain SB210) TaxID=312017 RepID=W7X586_TETTS|nr:hypothetical protein TTHERM_000644629 [Tetrahymena thermophila SB210]EWS74525.1 hypothetical protein TTHERM_000644629 [Tetrahymena thermophila SB210]|eukprot:XP_012652955.1 hypothetical protein TTHERM_000644629 [Tetrahymena thermophila SB210]
MIRTAIEVSKSIKHNNKQIYYLFIQSVKIFSKKQQIVLVSGYIFQIQNKMFKIISLCYQQIIFLNHIKIQNNDKNVVRKLIEKKKNLWWQLPFPFSIFSQIKKVFFYFNSNQKTNKIILIIFLILVKGRVKNS